jgi:hypothetical protein
MLAVAQTLAQTPTAESSFKGSIDNFDNSPFNFQNSPYNYANSPYNFANSQYNAFAPNAVYDAQGRRAGYTTTSESGVTNLYDNQGNRTGYAPK